MVLNHHPHSQVVTHDRPKAASHPQTEKMLMATVTRTTGLCVDVCVYLGMCVCVFCKQEASLVIRVMVLGVL